MIRMHAPYNLNRFVRVTTTCVQDPILCQEVLEPGIRDLVLGLHGRSSIRCIASCHGHGWFLGRGLQREPYLYFHSDPQLAEWLAALVEVLPLSRQWHITGTMHPEHGLCFLLSPLEQEPILGAGTKNRTDLAMLAKTIPEYTGHPGQHYSTYLEKKDAARHLVGYRMNAADLTTKSFS